VVLVWGGVLTEWCFIAVENLVSNITLEKSVFSKGNGHAGVVLV
jgi:hypothetical protein